MMVMVMVIVVIVLLIKFAHLSTARSCHWV